MTPPPIPFWFNRKEDETRAVDGSSRYRTYLRGHAAEFDPYEEGKVTDDPVRFAVAAWRIATGPIMAPPFIRFHPRILSATAAPDDWNGAHLLVTVETVSALPAALNARNMGKAWWRGWQWNDQRGYVEADRGSGDPPFLALPTLTLVVPVAAAELHRPQTPQLASLANVEAPVRPRPYLEDALAALAAVVTALNAELRDLITALDTAG